MNPILSLLISELFAASLWFSYSERLACVPNWQEYSTDYEFRLGGRTENFMSDWIWERELDYIGKGRENKYLFKVKDLKYKDQKLGRIKIGGEDYARSIWNINYQKQYAIYEASWKNLSAGTGISYVWEHEDYNKLFRQPAPCLKTILEYHNVIDIQFNQETDFYDRTYRDLYIGCSYSLKIPDDWSIVKMLFNDIFDVKIVVYRKYVWFGEEKRAFQQKAKLELEYDFTQLFKKNKEFE